MTAGQKIYESRKKLGMTQEELADRLGVTRQAVSKWEQDIAFPETEKVLELCKLFRLSADELLLGREGAPQETEDGRGVEWGIIDHRGKLRFEYISKRKWLGIPLVHINLGFGCRAHGIFAIGLIAVGFVSIGLLSVGFLALGVLAVGLLAFGSIAFGGAVFGGIALGIFAFGGIAVGVISFGGLAVGNFALGGLATGRIAIGDWASGWLAVGKSHASGTHAFLVGEQSEALSAWLSENLSPSLAKLIRTFAYFLTP